MYNFTTLTNEIAARIIDEASIDSEDIVPTVYKVEKDKMHFSDSASFLVEKYEQYKCIYIQVVGEAEGVLLAAGGGGHPSLSDTHNEYLKAFHTQYSQVRDATKYVPYVTSLFRDVTLAVSALGKPTEVFEVAPSKGVEFATVVVGDNHLTEVKTADVPKYIRGVLSKGLVFAKNTHAVNEGYVEFSEMFSSDVIARRGGVISGLSLNSCPELSTTISKHLDDIAASGLPTHIAEVLKGRVYDSRVGVWTANGICGKVFLIPGGIVRDVVTANAETTPAVRVLFAEGKPETEVILVDRLTMAGYLRKVLCVDLCNVQHLRRNGAHAKGFNVHDATNLSEVALEFTPGTVVTDITEPDLEVVIAEHVVGILESCFPITLEKLLVTRAKSMKQCLGGKDALRHILIPGIYHTGQLKK